MHIILNNASMVPIYEQVMDQIKNQILSEELKAGEALPSVRSLAAELRISALTVKKAYDRLEEDHFVVTVHGKGTYVAEADKDLALEARRRAAEEVLASAVEKAINAGMQSSEIRQFLELLLEEQK